MSISQILFTNKLISKALWENDINILKHLGNIAVILYIYGYIANSTIFLIDRDNLST